MFSALPENIQHEIEQLIARYGQPVTQTFALDSNGDFEPINKKDRYGEVCMVIRRPNERLITMIKTYYPKNAFRLLTGGINHGENIIEALLRETEEETGLKVEVRRFLAVAAYQLPQTGKKPVFYTFAFLLDEVEGNLGAIDEGEQVGEFREIEVDELRTIAENLDQLGTHFSNGEWRDWGKFRAIIHRLVWQALQA